MGYVNVVTSTVIYVMFISGQWISKYCDRKKVSHKLQVWLQQYKRDLSVDL